MTQHDDTVPGSTRPTRRASQVLSKIPAAVVVAAMVVLAVWGHKTGWKAPKFSSLTSAGTVAASEDWCAQHNVPDSICIKCHPELVNADMKDWCPEHGVPESKCSICHPEILTTGVAGDWCPEHTLPESSCTLCHPEIAIKSELKGVSNTKVVLAESPEPASAPTTAPTKAAKNPKTCQTHALRVQFAFKQSVTKAGVQLGQVAERPMSNVLIANAETDYDRTRYAELASPVAGRMWRVLKQVGDEVRKGEVLALVDSAEVGKAKAELLQAAADLQVRRDAVKRIATAAEKGFRPAADQQEADAAERPAAIRLFNARQALINLGLPASETALPDAQATEQIRFLGLPEDVAKSLDRDSATANIVPLVAPLDGTVLEQRAVAGMQVDPTTPLYVMADTSRLWLVIDLAQGDAKRVAKGQQVTFQPDDAPDAGVKGEITWMSTAVEDKTRTIRVRASLASADRTLLARSFGKARITLREKADVIAVPDESVQWEGCCNIVFVRLTDTIFQTRKVKLGARANGFTEITAGVLPGEVVATAGSHVLKSEILKSALGAGCTDH